MITTELNKIHNFDCLEFMRGMPSACIDMVLTDPPYNMAYSGRGQQNFKPLENDDINEQEHTEWMKSIVQELYRVSKDDAHLYMWVDWRNYPRFYNVVKSAFKIKNCLVWDKNNFGMGQDYRYQHEFCIYATKGSPALYFEKKNVPNVISISKETVSDYVHPTQKPITLFEMLIRW
jgi:DNA modification methylase